MSYPDLEQIFQKFCAYIDRKLSWTGFKSASARTSIVRDFFHAYVEEVRKPLHPTQKIDEMPNYMAVDYVVRSYIPSGDRKTLYRIWLAVEHENRREASTFLEKEIRHLIDLKCLRKIAVTYPQQARETEVLNGIKQMISDSWMYGTLRGNIPEEYLVILGFPCRKNGERVFLWKGYLLNSQGKLIRPPMEKVTSQVTKTVDG